MANVIHTQIASVMEVLANAAVAEICKLIEDSYCELQLEISQTQKENSLLKRRLKMIEIRESFYRRANKLRNESTVFNKTIVQTNVPDNGRISVKVSTLPDVNAGKGEVCSVNVSVPQPERVAQCALDEEPDIVVIKEEGPDNLMDSLAIKETEATENREGQYKDNEVFESPQREKATEQSTVQHCHQESAEVDEPDVFFVKEERPDTRCKETGGGTSMTDDGDAQYCSTRAFASAHRESFIDQDTVQHCHQETSGMQPVLLGDENPEDSAIERGCDNEGESNLHPAASYLSWVSRRFEATANHQSYADSECNEGSVNQYLVYRESADPICSYTSPGGSNSLSMSTLEGRLTHDEGQPELPPFTRCYSPHMQRKDRFMCKVCGKAFSQPSTMLLHQKLHTRERLHHCSLCGKRFSQASSLKRHYSIHRGEKPFRCQHCGKHFSDQSNLKKHVTVHTGEKPYGCNLCGKMFNQSSNLKTHMKIHTREKPFGCERCGRMFAHKYILVKHQQKMCAASELIQTEQGREYST